MAEDRKRFAHLLQPIRSLSDNWDIDIATELEDYLEDLEELTFSFEDGPSLNFAEAALVIQGSACVYSRKVEYLHGLVYNALDVIAESKRRQNRNRGGANAGDEDSYVDEEATFLVLETTIDEGASIDLDEDSGSSLGGVARPPPAILALEDASANTEGHGDDSGSFKISFCHVHSSGALLLEKQDDVSMENQQIWLDFIQADMAEDNNSMPRQSGAESAAQEVHEEGADIDGTFAQAAMQDDDRPVEALHREPVGEALEPDYGADGNDDFGEPDFADDAADHVEQEPEPEVFDPYAPLDMYDGGGHKPRPFRRLRIRPNAKNATPVTQPSEGLFAVPTASVNGCTYPEFQYALDALRAADLAATKHRETRRVRQAGESCFTAALAEASGSHEDVASEQGDGADAYADDDHDDGFGDQLDALDNWDEQGARAWEPLGENPLDAMPAEALSYEVLCKAHIDAFIAKAAAAEVQTELASRVSNWQSRIEPALEEQNKHGVFDIHAYGEAILNNLESAASSSDGTALGFESAVHAEQKHEVSRTFSAMLQLINNGNITIHRGEESDSPFHLQLVTKELAHKQMGVSGALGFHCNANSIAEGRPEQDENDGSHNVSASEVTRSPALKAARKAPGGRGRRAVPAK